MCILYCTMCLQEPDLRGLRKSNTITPMRHSMSPYQMVAHIRSTSYQVPSVTRRTPLLIDNKGTNHVTLTGTRVDIMRIIRL